MKWAISLRMFIAFCAHYRPFHALRNGSFNGTFHTKVLHNDPWKDNFQPNHNSLIGIFWVELWHFVNGLTQHRHQLDQRHKIKVFHKIAGNILKSARWSRQKKIERLKLWKGHFSLLSMAVLWHGLEFYILYKNKLSKCHELWAKRKHTQKKNATKNQCEKKSVEIGGHKFSNRRNKRRIVSNKKR